ncbi:MAG: paraquat-inducible protein A [Cytophagaceae bacterium]
MKALFLAKKQDFYILYVHSVRVRFYSQNMKDNSFLLKSHTYILLFLFMGIAVNAVLILKTGHRRQELKEDWVEISEIKYGLFNMDHWKTVIAEVLEKKINEFELEDSNKVVVQMKVEKFLYKTINEFESKFYRDNQKTLSGSMKNMVVSYTGMMDKIKSEVPNLSKQVVDFISKPQNKVAIKYFIKSKLDEYFSETYAAVDYTASDLIVKKYHQTSIAEAKSEIQRLIDKQDTMWTIVKIALIILAGSAGMILFLISSLSRADLLLSILISLSLMILGIAMPMIEIDARIAELKFTFLGESVQFTNQVLYYKSKSIMEVVSLMLTQKKTDVFIVGLLIFSFSVLFPAIKLVSSILLLYRPEWNHPVIRFFVFKSGKWSMADVMVVAIFMAYIGFSGIITEQLFHLEKISNQLSVLTTNESSLQIGFYAFISFVMISMLISYRIQKLQKEGRVTELTY